jgi:hypothetical protein
VDGGGDGGPGGLAQAVMIRPVVEMAVWVLAYSGRTPASAASTKARERPVAVWSA